jgi:hypothetical protein
MIISKLESSRMLNVVSVQSDFIPSSLVVFISREYRFTSSLCGFGVVCLWFVFWLFLTVWFACGCEAW